MIPRVLVVCLAIALLQNSAICFSSTDDKRASENDAERDLQLWFRDDDCVAVLCEFKYEEGITTYRIVERWTKSEDPPFLRTALKAKELSFKTGVDNRAWPNPAVCIVIAAPFGNKMLPVIRDHVEDVLQDGRMSSRISVEKYKRLVIRAAAHHQ
jgi:hypothetical protein